MRLLFATYSLAFQNPGGGERVLVALKSELEAMGHTIDFFDPWRSQVSNYDIIHYFSCLETSFWHHVKRQAPQVPLVVTPTLFFEDGLGPRFAAAIKRRARLFAQRFGDPNLNRWRHLNLPNMWLPTTAAEARGLAANWNIAATQMRVLPNGVGSQFRDAKPDLFRAASGISSPFSLHVGRFHPVKNQNILIEAIRRVKGTGVFIGDPDPAHRGYYEECRRLAGRCGEASLHFIPALRNEDPLLASAYAACSVFVLPSTFETFGIAPLEAAVAGAPLILTRTMRSRDLFQDFARFVDPSDLANIASELELALSGQFPRIPEKQRLMLAERYGWNHISRELSGIYRSLAGLPTTRDPGATSRLTTDPAPTTQ